MPEIAAPPPAPAVEPVPEIVAVPKPDGSVPAPEPEVVREPEAMEAQIEAAPMEAAQTPVAEAGAGGAADAIRAEWLGELRRRIEAGKYYPRAARNSRETGRVLLRVAIGPAAEIGVVEILENTGSAMLAEGALAILRRAAERPLGTNALPAGFEVDVPITYEFKRR